MAFFSHLTAMLPPWHFAMGLQCVPPHTQGCKWGAEAPSPFSGCSEPPKQSRLFHYDASAASLPTLGPDLKVSASQRAEGFSPSSPLQNSIWLIRAFLMAKGKRHSNKEGAFNESDPKALWH